ncbi:hypothetical protein BN2475_380130 [Paraburkholderia ribeironis]|uniref:Uncharacterized protein n=1 Tax=Paraburkholderia ribeironis TaxID=1247936 RepID=A0A1N7S665_9BURK|nr:hypothetical protein BN2475_380130 [Paraburkholderia ribeironis]
MIRPLFRTFEVTSCRCAGRMSTARSPHQRSLTGRAPDFSRQIPGGAQLENQVSNISTLRGVKLFNWLLLDKADINTAINVSIVKHGYKTTLARPAIGGPMADCADRRAAQFRQRIAEIHYAVCATDCPCE